MRILTCCMLFVSLLVAVAQDVYFVDGYHGGIYGHYPVEWKTRFIVDQLKANPDWCIGLEIEPETWDTVKVKTPIDYADFKQMVSTGRQIEFTNPTYAQPYCYNISGESIIRQFKYGIEKIKKHFPSVEFSTYSVEEPCFTSCLPQLLSQFGFKYASLKCPNTCWGGYVSAYGGELVNWIGSDGTSMLSVPRYECEDFEKNSTWQTIAWRSQRKFWNACFDMGIKHPVGMCYQDAGWKGGPWLGRRNRAKYVTWTDYIENVTSRKTDNDWHFSQEDVRVSLMWGSQVLQRIGRQVRRAENAMVVAEKMSAIAFVSDGYHMRQTCVDEGWRTLMLAQHHDSWIVPYNGLNKRGTWAQNIKCWTDTTISIANVEKLRAAEMFGQTTGTARYIKVFNTSGSARRDVVEVSCFGENISRSIKLVDANGLSADGVIEEGTLRFVADVPAFGYNTYRLAESDGRSITKYRVNGNIVETGFYKIEFDLNRGGVISSFISKRDGNKELIDVNNQLSFGELRGFFYDLGRFCSSTESPAEMTVVRDNGIDVKVCIKGNISKHPFVQTYTLSDVNPIVKSELTIDWKENVGIGEYYETDKKGNRRAFYDDRYKLSVLFPIKLNKTEVYKDAPFDVCKSSNDNTFFNEWQKIKHNIVLNWVEAYSRSDDYALTVFSDHTTTYSHGEDYPLSLTAQYSGGGLWWRDYGINGPMAMNYAFMPHKGEWNVAGVQSASESFNEPMTAIVYSGNTDMDTKSYIDLSGTGYQLSAACEVEGKLMVRIFNASGSSDEKSIKFNLPISQIEEVDLNGDVKNECKVKQGLMLVAIPRFGIRTYMISLE